jgi:integrase
MVARVLDEAREEGLVHENVARGVKLPRREETKEAWTWLTPGEFATVLALDLTLEQRTAITVAAYQGLRLGELAALTWEHVTLDGERPALVIAASWKRGTKSGKVRRIPLLDPARFALLRWQPDLDKRTGLVFPSPKGGMYAKGVLLDTGRRLQPRRCGQGAALARCA